MTGESSVPLLRRKIDLTTVVRSSAWLVFEFALKNAALLKHVKG